MLRAILIALMMFAAAPASADKCDDAYSAYQRKDYSTAVRLFQDLAEQGNANAQYNLGNLYRTGQGVPQDYAEAARWYRLSAKQGDAEAQNNLGYMYGKGEGVLQDNTTAHMWYNIASANGNAMGGESREIAAKKNDTRRYF